MRFKAFFLAFSMAFFSCESLSQDLVKIIGGSVEIKIDKFITGDGAVPEGELVLFKKNIGGLITLQLEDFNTKNQGVERVTARKKLGVKHFPFAYLVVYPVRVSAAKPFKWKGRLTLRDVSKPVSGHAFYHGGGLIASAFEFDLSDYPAIGLARKVFVKTTLQLDREPQ